MQLDKTLFDNLLTQAAVNPRLRQSMDLRNSPEDLSQRMLNALLPGTVLPIHRHAKTSETLVLLCGKMEEIFYEEAADGALRESERILLSAEGPVQGLNIPLGRWHSINVLEPTVILECKDGKYEPLSQDDMISM